MTSNNYIIDSSSLIELHRNNPMDIYPSVWRNLEVLIKKGLLMAPKEVFYEIKDSDDQLSKWARDHQDLFRRPSKKQMRLLRGILKDYPAISDESRKHDADPWVITLAMEAAKDSQETLVPTRRIVVTEEKIKGEKIRIPFICNKNNVCGHVPLLARHEDHNHSC